MVDEKETEERQRKHIEDRTKRQKADQKDK